MRSVASAFVVDLDVRVPRGGDSTVGNRVLNLRTPSRNLQNNPLHNWVLSKRKPDFLKISRHTKSLQQLPADPAYLEPKNIEDGGSWLWFILGFRVLKSLIRLSGAEREEYIRQEWKPRTGDQ